MLEFLNGTYYYKDGSEGEISGYNPKTNKVIIKGYDAEGEDEVEKLFERNIFDNTGVVKNIHYHENWEHKLYEQLRWKGKATIYVLSTESGDDWFLEVHRYKTEIPQSDFSNKVTIINYAVVFCGEVKGEILAKQYKMLDDTAGDSERDFSKWINNQIDEVPTFNNTEEWKTVNAIVLSDAFNSDEEINAMYDMFNEIHEIG